jgi:hypothetical protein
MNRTRKVLSIILKNQHGSRKESHARSEQSLYGSTRQAMSRTSPAKGALIFCSSSRCFNTYTFNSSLNHLSRQFQLRDMKCNIDNKCPREASHLKIKAKTKTIMEERFAQIESENRLLLEKMSHILRVSFTSSRFLRPRS